MPRPRENRTTQRIVIRRGKIAILTEAPYKYECDALRLPQRAKK